MCFNLLFAKNLVVKRSESFTLNVPEFLIKEKSVTGLVGNNGAGKTTFLQSILCLVNSSFKELKIFNSSWEENALEIKKNIGVYLDETYLIDYMTMEEYFNFLNYIFKNEVEMFSKSKNELINALRVDIKNKQLINELSSGNQTKLGIIGSLLHHPKLVIWDEPFANLDPYSRSMLIDIILQFKKRNGTSFIISSHNIDELYEYSDNFLCLDNGSVVANDSKSNLTKTDILKFLGVNVKNNSHS